MCIRDRWEVAHQRRVHLDVDEVHRRVVAACGRDAGVVDDARVASAERAEAAALDGVGLRDGAEPRRELLAGLVVAGVTAGLNEPTRKIARVKASRRDGRMAPGHWLVCGGAVIEEAAALASRLASEVEGAEVERGVLVACPCVAYAIDGVAEAGLEGAREHMGVRLDPEVLHLRVGDAGMGEEHR